MILRTEIVDQIIEGTRRGTFVKEVIMAEGPQPLAMVRKRAAPVKSTRGAVVLVHGFGQNRYSWHISRRSFVNYLASHGWDVFNVDLRGHGRSRRFGARRPRYLDEYIQQDMPAFLEEVRELSGHDRPFLVGHSMGGLISYASAATSVAGQVGGIVSIASPYHFGAGSLSLRALRQLGNAVRRLDADANPPVHLRALGKHFLRGRVLWDNRRVPLPIRVWLPGSLEEDLLEEYLERAFDRTSLAVALAIVRAGSEAAMLSEDGAVDYSAAFEALQLPLLVVAGSHDGLAPPDSVRPAFERSRSHDKTYRELPLGHIDLVVGREAPMTVWPIVQTWLQAR